MEHNSDAFEGENDDILGLSDKNIIKIDDGIRVGKKKQDGKNPRVDESIYSMIKDTRKDEKDYSGNMKHQSTVGGTDINNSNMIMNDKGVTKDLDLEKKCDDDA